MPTLERNSTLAGELDQCLHVVEVSLELAASLRRQLELGV
jgi:hypothetical protein